MNMLEMGAKKHLQDPFGSNGKCRFYMDLLRKSEILMVTGILGWGASRETCQKPSTEQQPHVTAALFPCLAIPKESTQWYFIHLHSMIISLHLFLGRLCSYTIALPLVMKDLSILLLPNGYPLHQPSIRLSRVVLEINRGKIPHLCRLFKRTERRVIGNFGVQPPADQCLIPRWKSQLKHI